MNKPYFTRKNLLVLALSIVYSFIILFVGLCLEGSYTFVNENNPFAMIAKELNFKVISCGVSGYVCLALVAIYVVVATGFLIYERRFAIVNNRKPYRPKMLLIYLGTIVLCLILSLGLGLIIQSPLTKENVGNVALFVGQSMLLALFVFLALLIVVVTLLMLIVNFIFIDKPFKFFNKEHLAELEDDEEENVDVKTSFGVNNQTSSNGGQVTTTTPVVSEESSTVSKAEELDDREKVFPTLTTVDVKYEGYAIESIDTDSLTLEGLCNLFRMYLAYEEKLYFDIDTIRIFISGFAASHFMILEGLSGTGKSSLPRYFAKFVNANVLFVPVQATWRDKTNILGYFNDFSKTYHETDFLVSLYEANYNLDRINIFVLDEMNISRVEYYFADFLSVLEYPEDQWKLRVMQLPFGFVPPAKLENGYIQIPANSYFVGTANKDDSTFSITDKVYDRAITIDFDNRNTPFVVNDKVAPITLSNSKLQSLYKEALDNKANAMTQADLDKFETISNFIYEEFDLTFGNRILNQIEVLVPTFIACGGKKEDALDFLLSRKIIVKLEGRFEEYVKSGLKQLLVLIEKTYGKNVFNKSTKIINNLIRKL